MDTTKRASPFENKLPIGYIENSTWVRSYVPRELSTKDVRHIKDRTFAVQHPIGWVLRTLAISIESIGGVSVFDEYEKSKRKVIPEVLKKIPMGDSTFLIAAAHVHTFGTKVEEVQLGCPACKTKFVSTLDMQSIEVQELSEAPGLVTVQLARGWSSSTDLPGAKASQQFVKYVFRTPTIGDALEFEDLLKPGDTSTFNDKVLAQALVKAIDQDGVEIGQDALSIARDMLIQDLMAKDTRIINIAMSKFPRMEDELHIKCPKCNNEFTYDLDQNFFFRLG